MANCNNLFQDFDTNLGITDTKRQNMIRSRKDLEERIKKHFREKHNHLTPKFYIQGSYKMKTMIRTVDDDCDMDLGVYFFPKPDETPTTLQKWIKEAVEDATDTPPMHKKKCIRVRYKGENNPARRYHIDIPVYYRDSEMTTNSPYLGLKDEGWQQSDPKKFRQWYNDKKDDDNQLTRLVRYLKAWANHKKDVFMPKGVTLTVLAANYLRTKSDRDDEALYETLRSIKASLDVYFYCQMPVTPFDNLLAAFDVERRRKFLEVLQAFIDDAKKALDNECQYEASQLWQKHLGKRFPDGKKIENSQEAHRNALLQKAGIIATGAYTTPTGVITHLPQQSVRNQPHLFYGD